LNKSGKPDLFWRLQGLIPERLNHFVIPEAAKPLSGIQ